ncbi:MAG: competence/damage-inducible protein A [Chloroflexota bacterium]|nr:competence/damage-inducible protein A [Chloroflexota bacterium]
MANNSTPLKAEIISVGTEILLGYITDTNATYLSQRLPELGIGNYRVTTIGDNVDRLTTVLEAACERSDLVVITGGLGPTEDDITREALAKLAGEIPILDPKLNAHLNQIFSQRGIPMPDRNLKQAEIIPSADPINNSRGTAPGWWVKTKGTLFIAMPGVPREMYEMWEQEVIPKIHKNFLSEDSLIKSRTIKTFGMSEALVDEKLGLLLRSSNPTIGVYAKSDGIHIRITAYGKSSNDVAALIAPVEQKVVNLLGIHVWGYDEDTLEKIILNRCSDQGKTVSIMESCTGGLLASMLTDIEGSSKFFLGSFVTYSSQMKESMGVSHNILEKYGAISAECATAMALSAREKTGASIGIGITGIGGQDSVEGKTPGLAYIAICDKERSKVREGIFPINRQDFKLRVTRTAMFELQGWIKDIADV